MNNVDNKNIQYEASESCASCDSSKKLEFDDDEVIKKKINP